MGFLLVGVFLLFNAVVIISAIAYVLLEAWFAFQEGQWERGVLIIGLSWGLWKLLTIERYPFVPNGIVLKTIRILGSMLGPLLLLLALTTNRSETVQQNVLLGFVLFRVGLFALRMLCRNWQWDQAVKDAVLTVMSNKVRAKGDASADFQAGHVVDDIDSNNSPAAVLLYANWLPVKMINGLLRFITRSKRERGGLYGGSGGVGNATTTTTAHAMTYQQNALDDNADTDSDHPSKLGNDDSDGHERQDGISSSSNSSLSPSMVDIDKLYNQIGRHVKLRILILGDAWPPKVDGVAVFSRQAVKILSERGHKLEILTSIPGPQRIEGAKVNRVYGFPVDVSPGHYVSIPTPELIRVIRNFKPDVIHCFELSPLTLIGSVYCRLLGIPVTMSHHTRIDMYGVLLAKNILTSLSGPVISLLESFFFPFPDAHLATCHPLIDTTRAHGGHNVSFWTSASFKKFDVSHYSQTMRNRLTKGNPSVPLVIYVGRISREKNGPLIPDIIKRTVEVMGGIDKIRFAIVGNGLIVPDLIKQLEGYPAVFTGNLHGEELLQAYASSDVFFSPSITETFPLVYLEAMRSGNAVVAPAGTGSADTFTHGQQGFAYPQDDPINGTAIAIKKCLDAGEEMRENAVRHGKSFSWSKSMSQLEKCLVKTVFRANAYRMVDF